MKLLLARHGRTNYNDLRLCNSDPKTDVHLTEAGIAQAHDLAHRLKSVEIERIFVSELKRTKQTAAIVNEYHHVPVVVDARLNDNRSGFEDKPAADYRAALAKAKDPWKVRFNNGESIEDVKGRVQSFLNDLKTVHDTIILVITSEVIIKAFCQIIDDLTYEQANNLEVSQASLRQFDLD